MPDNKSVFDLEDGEESTSPFLDPGRRSSQTPVKKETAPPAAPVTVPVAPRQKTALPTSPTAVLRPPMPRPPVATQIVPEPTKSPIQEPVQPHPRSYNGSEKEHREPVVRQAPVLSRGTKSQNRKTSETTDGGRKRVLIIRWAVLGAIGLFSLLGIKSIILPPGIPSATEIVTNVQAGLGITNFPASQGEGFVLSFIRTYLNYDPAKTTERTADLARYVDVQSLSANGIVFTADQTQSIVSGPYDSGIRYIDNNNAIYTISTQIGTGAWVYLAVPVYYDPTGRAFAISAPPSIVPAPSLAKVPAQTSSLVEDEQATASAKNTVIAFFQSWGASNDQELSVVIDANSDARARHGLGGIATFKTLDSFIVYKSASQAATDAGIIEAHAQVTWTAAGVTYHGNYRLMLVYKAGGKWTIRDILPLGTNN